MLGALALLAMLAGAFAAAGGIFNWEFLFSDGRYPREWAASMGRAAARTLLGLAGGALLAGGFVSRVIAVANMPIEAAPTLDDMASSSPSHDDNSTGYGGTPKSGAAVPTDNRESIGVSGPGRMNQSATASQAPSAVAAPPPPASKAQTITLWNPTAVIEPGGTMLFTAEYRFEGGHRPRAGEHYLWIIDLADKTRAVEYDGDALQKQGQLRHLIQTPEELAHGLGVWDTMIRVGPDESARQISNRLIINGDQVESEPL